MEVNATDSRFVEYKEGQSTLRVWHEGRDRFVLEGGLLEPDPLYFDSFNELRDFVADLQRIVDKVVEK